MHHRTTSTLVLALTACAFAAPLNAQSSKASPALSADLQNVKTALEKYQDPMVALRDGYFSTHACVAFADGAMGVHFLNLGMVGPTADPAKPPVLLYEQVGDRLKLTGAEWFVPLATGVKERPQLFGQPFDGPMPGHEPIMPVELTHYDLHVWLFKDNPDGMFAPANRAVKCADGPYSFTSKETAKQHGGAHKH